MSDRNDRNRRFTDEEPEQDGSKKALVTGVAVGIGSAAIVAALLYASRRKVKRPVD